MTVDYREQLRQIHTFPSLVRFLRDELDWPVATDDFEELTFDYRPEELGIDAENAAKIDEIKRLRPLVANQPWGIFFVKFEPKQLPVVALRRILNRVVVKKRATGSAAEQQKWATDDLLFISAYGHDEERRINFAHFSHDGDDGALATLRVLAWDERDTGLHLDDVAHRLFEYLSWPTDADEYNAETWRERWSSAFELRHREVVDTSRELAIELADLARAVRERINAVLEIESDEGPVTQLMNAFREALVHDLEPDDFADMYAQTIAYGLLSARISHPSSEQSTERLPVTNPFLKELMETFLHVGDGQRGREKEIDFDELGVNDVIELLDLANIEAVVRDFGDANPLEDPVIHFYELFLKEYDPRKRMQRGVFYTPRPVVSYIVRSVHELLRTEFGLEDGLADTATWGEVADGLGIEIPHGIERGDRFVTILDPAMGTGTFLVEVIDVIHHTLVEKWTYEAKTETEIRELWNEYIPSQLLPRMHGYELLMAPYAIAHLKIGLKLHETGYRFESEERARMYLTNALEPAQDFSDRLDFAIPALAHEAKAVNEVKATRRFTVVIGNPPYSKMSANLGESAVSLVEPFRFVRGERIVEKGALALELNLQDDYVKFWGLLCAQLDRARVGVGSYITNSRYLSSPTLRGLRAYMAFAFRRGFFLDLGGQVSERRGGGVSDANVFDIEQGVAIAAVVTQTGDDSMNEIRVGRLTGSRSEKYAALQSSVITTLPDTINLTAPMFGFSRERDASDEEFESWSKLDDLMPFNSGSIITSRDNLAIDFDQNRLLEKIEMFANSPRGDHTVLEEIGFSAKSKWDIERCKSEIRGISDPATCVKRVLYRPFDVRYVFYLPSLLDTPSRPVCESIWACAGNLVLLTPGVKTTNDFNHVLVSRHPAEKKACSHDRATQMFPLRVSGGELASSCAPNITPLLDDAGDEDSTLAYVYAILHSPTYRARYGGALRDSYPRLPIARSDLRKELAPLGRDLIDLHLMEPPQTLDLTPTYRGAQDPEVSRVGWSDDVVWLDAPKTSAVDGYVATAPGTVGVYGVSRSVWDFQIGGYQVCHKWLKDRKGRTLSEEDVDHYKKIVVAISETMRLMSEIDDVIEAHGGWPGAFVGPMATAAA
jgi:predicted helicase